jgi:thiol-disulfide isomerase/thioredoxin
MLLPWLIRHIAMVGFGLLTFAASALTLDDYSPAAVAKARAAGQSHALIFHADWCPTCKQQEKVFEQLKQDPALKNVTLFSVDYDGEVELRKTLKVRGQSTLIVYKGPVEAARTVGETSVAGLKQTLLKSL